MDFKSRQELKVATDDWLDIPTNIRQNTINNKAHKKVFAVDFKSRPDLKVATDDWLDIPTHIRQNKSIHIDHE